MFRDSVTSSIRHQMHIALQKWACAQPRESVKGFSWLGLGHKADAGDAFRDVTSRVHRPEGLQLKSDMKSMGIFNTHTHTKEETPPDPRKSTLASRLGK